ncbi:hypothetical protein LCGC14_2924850, partial [marine sediment metagenome]
PVRWNIGGRLGGTHRVEGILVVNGQHVKSGYKLQANIADITPTVLSCLGLPVSADMEGKALTELFSRAVEVEFEPPREHLPVGAEEEVYSEQEKKLLITKIIL